MDGWGRWGGKECGGAGGYEPPFGGSPILQMKDCKASGGREGTGTGRRSWERAGVAELSGG